MTVILESPWIYFLKNLGCLGLFSAMVLLSLCFHFIMAYQMDKAMLPFLCADLYKITNTLMDLFVKHKIMAPVSSGHQLLKINVYLKDKSWRQRRKVFANLTLVVERTLKSPWMVNCHKKGTLAKVIWAYQSWHESLLHCISHAISTKPH